MTPGIFLTEIECRPRGSSEPFALRDFYVKLPSYLGLQLGFDQARHQGLETRFGKPAVRVASLPKD